MIDFESHKQKLEEALRVRNPETKKNCIDKIEEKLWVDNVMPALNDISLKAADELQKETGRSYHKDSNLVNPSTGKKTIFKSVEDLVEAVGDLEPDEVPRWVNGYIVAIGRDLKYSQAPPTRLLSLTLNLCYFLGFLDASNNHEMDEENGIGAQIRIEETYRLGKESHPNSKSNQTNAKT